MEQQFRLSPGAVDQIARRKARPLLIASAIPAVIIFPQIIPELSQFNNGTIIVTIFILWFVALFLAIYEWALFTLRQTFRNSIYIISDAGVERRFVPDEELSGFARLTWPFIRDRIPEEKFLSWGQLAGIYREKHFLVLKTEKASMLSTKGRMGLPREVENYDAAEQLIAKVSGLPVKY